MECVPNVNSGKQREDSGLLRMYVCCKLEFMSRCENNFFDTISPGPWYFCTGEAKVVVTSCPIQSISFGQSCIFPARLFSHNRNCNSSTISVFTFGVSIWDSFRFVGGGG